MDANAGSDRSGHLWSVASLALAICASIALLFVPFLSESFHGTGTGQQTYEVVGPRHTLLDADGVSAVPILLWPILITALAVRLSSRGYPRRLRGFSALLFLPLLPLGDFVIGGFYLPSGLAMVVAWLRSPWSPESRGDASS